MTLVRAKLGNEQQVKIIIRFLEGFEGKLTSSRYATLTRVSQDTANRDIADLVAKSILQKSEAGGRSTSYGLILPQPKNQSDFFRCCRNRHR